jgi:hypothetical protein
MSGCHHLGQQEKQTIKGTVETTNVTKIGQHNLVASSNK